MTKEKELLICQLKVAHTPQKNIRAVNTRKKKNAPITGKDMT